MQNSIKFLIFFKYNAVLLQEFCVWAIAFKSGELQVKICILKLVYTIVAGGEEADLHILFVAISVNLIIFLNHKKQWNHLQIVQHFRLRSV